MKTIGVACRATLLGHCPKGKKYDGGPQAFALLFLHAQRLILLQRLSSALMGQETNFKVIDAVCGHSVGLV